MKNKDVHVQFTPEHYDALKRIAQERGINMIATLVRSVVVEHLHLQELAEEDPHGQSLYPREQPAAEAATASSSSTGIIIGSRTVTSSPLGE